MTKKPDPTPVLDLDDTARLAAARRLAGWLLGDPGWADRIIRAYADPDRARAYVDREMADYHQVMGGGHDDC